MSEQMDFKAILNQVGKSLRKWNKVLDLLEQFYQEYSKGTLGNVERAGGVLEKLMDAYADWKGGTSE